MNQQAQWGVFNTDTFAGAEYEFIILATEIARSYKINGNLRQVCMSTRAERCLEQTKIEGWNVLTSM